jgi:hypothetical protein
MTSAFAYASRLVSAAALIALLALWPAPAGAQNSSGATSGAANPPQAQGAGPQDPAAPGQDQAALAPAIRLESDDHDAGEASPGSSVSYDFVVFNDGQAPLLISDVVPGCGCSVASFPDKVAPGESGVVTLTVDLYKEWAGHNVNKAAVILSNDPASPATRITMRAKVLPN